MALSISVHQASLADLFSFIACLLIIRTDTDIYICIYVYLYTNIYICVYVFMYQFLKLVKCYTINRWVEFKRISFKLHFSIISLEISEISTRLKEG